MVGCDPADLLEAFPEKGGHSFQARYISAAAVYIYNGLQIDEKLFKSVFNKR
jgi:hypothetical protein